MTPGVFSALHCLSGVHVINGKRSKLDRECDLDSGCLGSKPGSAMHCGQAILPSASVSHTADEGHVRSSPEELWELSEFMVRRNGADGFIDS